jgi:hypothetical protein
MSPSGLQLRPSNFHFHKFDILRLQTAFEIEFRIVPEMDNPSPQFLFTRLMMLHNQGQVNRQSLVPYTESWQFFLSDNNRRQIVDITSQEHYISLRIQGGPNQIFDLEVQQFYLGYKSLFEFLKKKASMKMWDTYKSKSKGRGQAWKLLKRIRG